MYNKSFDYWAIFLSLSHSILLTVNKDIHQIMLKTHFKEILLNLTLKLL